MDRRNLATAEKIAISAVSCEDHVGDFLRLVRRNPQRICSGGWNYQCSVLKRCNGKASKQNSMCWTRLVWIWLLVPFARQHPVPQRDNRQAVFGPTRSDCARPPSVFALFSTCWLPFVPKNEIPLEGASLWLDFGHPESRDKYIKHHCKGRLPQRHPEAVWPCKSVCTVRRDVFRKLNNKSVISFSHILFIMPVLKLSRRTLCTRYAAASPEH